MMNFLGFCDRDSVQRHLGFATVDALGLIFPRHVNKEY